MAKEIIRIQYTNQYTEQELFTFAKDELYKDESLWWTFVSVYQRNIPDQFLRQYADKLEWSAVLLHHDISDEFKMELQIKGYL